MTKTTYREIEISQVIPNPDQPRKEFNEKALRELAASILENGLVQPISVRIHKKGGKEKTVYMIVGGERRWRAHKLLVEEGKLPADATIKSVISAMDDEALAIGAILENLQRVDIKPLEEARAFQRAMDEHKLTAEQLARKLGLSQTWRVSYRTRLLKLSAEIQKLLDGGSISTNAASEIAKLDHEHDQMKVVRMISSGKIKTDTQVAAAVNAIEDALSQSDIFGEEQVASDEEVKTVNRMEAKIEQVSSMVAAGWKDGECRIASKVNPDRARLMAEKLSAIRKHLGQMERELLDVAAQADLLSDEAA